jgi:flavin-dependent dehydrogenase
MTGGHDYFLIPYFLFLILIKPMNDRFDIGVIGGGLAGLAISIRLAKAGHSVILFEKEQYPFHRVCGEYISMESWNFLESLGVDLSLLHVSMIRRLQLSGKNGKILEQALPLGGFGVSRYLLDSTLAGIAKSAGVVVEENMRVNDIVFTGKDIILSTAKRHYYVRAAAGSFGKRSNLDIKWKRQFVIAKKNRLNNYVGIKYHIRFNQFAADTIALHTFDNGYCGIVKIEADIYNLCYLTTAKNLQQCGGDISKMEQDILSRNPHLKKIFEESEKCMEAPVTISQISFDKKSLIEDHVLMAGDAAGMITPLCGNGMSMALHAGKLLAELMDLFLKGSISREEMEAQYIRQWELLFSARLRTGRQMQRILSSHRLTHFFIRVGHFFPGLIKWMIKQTHGKPF